MDETNLILSCQIPTGKRAIIRKIVSVDKDYPLRLREIGFSEGKIISKYSDEGHKKCIILGVGGIKIFVNEEAAHAIYVELIT